MSLRTFSRFYYGHTVTADNNSIDFDEGSGEITAYIDVGSYTPSEYAMAFAVAMTEAGGQEYAAEFNRTTRMITISADDPFDLLTSTGTTLGTTAFNMAGFTGSDRTGSDSYTGNAVSGSQYSPQFILQDHVASDDWNDAVGGVVNESASGEIEVVKFGQTAFVQFNIRYATDIAQPSSGPILSDASGVTNLRAFMNYAVTKAPIEFIPNVAALSTFQKLILESTPASPKGLGFKLKELYDVGIPGYFETGTLKWRVQA